MHAYYNTKGYRELYDHACAHPDDIQTLEDLRKLPFIEKEMIRDRLEDFSVPRLDGTYITTGETQGFHLGPIVSLKRLQRKLASKEHQYARVGW